MKKTLTSMALTMILVMGCGEASRVNSQLSAQTVRPKVMFDLGNVLVKFNEEKQMHYNTGAFEHLTELKNAGFDIGIITNIPESFGANCQTKFDKLKDFIASRWIDEREFDWSMFKTVVLPPRDALRKPHRFPFIQGLANSCKQKVMFVAEDLSEERTALGLGMSAHLVSEAEYFLPISKINTKLNSEFNFEYPEDCNFTDLFDHLTPDAGQEEGCVITPN